MVCISWSQGQNTNIKWLFSNLIQVLMLYIKVNMGLVEYLSVVTQSQVMLSDLQKKSKI